MALVARAGAADRGASDLRAASAISPGIIRRWSPRRCRRAMATGGDAGSMDEVTATLEEAPGAESRRRRGLAHARPHLPRDRQRGQGRRRRTRRPAQLLPETRPGLELDLAEALVLSDDPAAAAARQGNRRRRARRGRQQPEGALVLGRDRRARRRQRDGQDELAEAARTESARRKSARSSRASWRELGVVVPPRSAHLRPAAPWAARSMAGSPGDRARAADRAHDPGRRVDRSVGCGKLKPGVPLFVSARQPGIPGPPLAAVRLTSDELPATVTLSDANSMIEGRNLSSVDDVEVIARVAFGGTAITASGDLVGSRRAEEGRRAPTWASSSPRSSPEVARSGPPAVRKTAVRAGVFSARAAEQAPGRHDARRIRPNSTRASNACASIRAHVARYAARLRLRRVDGAQRLRAAHLSARARDAAAHEDLCDGGVSAAAVRA